MDCASCEYNKTPECDISCRRGRVLSATLCDTCDELEREVVALKKIYSAALVSDHVGTWIAVCSYRDEFGDVQAESAVSEPTKKALQSHILRLECAIGHAINHGRDGDQIRRYLTGTMEDIENPVPDEVKRDAEYAEAILRDLGLEIEENERLRKIVTIEQTNRSLKDALEECHTALERKQAEVEKLQLELDAAYASNARAREAICLLSFA